MKVQIDLDSLEPYFEELEIEPNYYKLDILHDLFINNFVQNDFYFNGRVLMVDKFKSRVKGFEHYIDGFVHLITRESKLKGKRHKDDRYFCRERANKSHWVKPVLELYKSNRIKYFKRTEHDGKIKEYYWFQDKYYIVILINITLDKKLITGFCVDKDEFGRFKRLYEEYLSAEAEPLLRQSGRPSPSF